MMWATIHRRGPTSMSDVIDPMRVFEASDQGGSFDYLSTGEGLIAQVPSEQVAAWEGVIQRAAAYEALLESLAKADA
jgi:hypothetical protein